MRDRERTHPSSLERSQLGNTWIEVLFIGFVKRLGRVVVHRRVGRSRGRVDRLGLDELCLVCALDRARLHTGHSIDRKGAVSALLRAIAQLSSRKARSVAIPKSGSKPDSETFTPE
jgi:hypothetical protein